MLSVSPVGSKSGARSAKRGRSFAFTSPHCRTAAQRFVQALIRAGAAVAPLPPLLFSAFSRLTTSCSARNFPGCPPSKRKSPALNPSASTAACCPPASIGEPWAGNAATLPSAVDSRTATFAYADPGHDTDSQLRSWGRAHQGLWFALKRQGLTVHVVAVSRNASASGRFQTILDNWASQSGAGGEPAVQQEIDEIQNALSPPDFSVLNRYGGFNEAGRAVRGTDTNDPALGIPRSPNRQLLDLAIPETCGGGFHDLTRHLLCSETHSIPLPF